MSELYRELANDTPIEGSTYYGDIDSVWLNTEAKQARLDGTFSYWELRTICLHMERLQAKLRNASG